MTEPGSQFGPSKPSNTKKLTVRLTDRGNYLIRTRDRIYRLVGLEGHSQARTAKALGISRQAVSRHIKNLTSDGYLRPVSGTGSPQIYRLTRKAYPRPSKRDHRGRFEKVDKIRAHHTSRIFRINSPAIKPFPWSWDKSWKASGVTTYIKRNLTLETRNGPISVKSLRLSSGPTRSSLTIYLDDDNLFTSDQIDTHEDAATETAMIITREIQLRTGMILSLPEIMLETHYAIPAPADIVDHAIEDGIKSDKIIFDRSMGKSETETTDPDIAVTWVDLPDILKGFREDINQIKTNMIDLITITKDEIDTIKGLDKRTRDLEKALEETKTGGMYQ